MTENQINPDLSPDVVAIVGNPRRDSRTLKLAGGVADGLATHFGNRPAVAIDLVDLDVGMGCFPPEVNRLVASAQVVIAASPTVMAADVHLRPALLELGATCSTPSLVALESELASLGTEGLVTAWLERSTSWLAVMPLPR